MRRSNSPNFFYLVRCSFKTLSGINYNELLGHKSIPIFRIPTDDLPLCILFSSRLADTDPNANTCLHSTNLVEYRVFSLSSIIDKRISIWSFNYNKWLKVSFESFWIYSLKLFNYFKIIRNTWLKQGSAEAITGSVSYEFPKKWIFNTNFLLLDTMKSVKAEPPKHIIKRYFSWVSEISTLLIKKIIICTQHL